MARWLHNLVRLPQRSLRSAVKRLSPVYQFQRAADRFARKQLSPQQRKALSEIGGTTSDHECRLLFYLACQAPGDGRLVEIGAFKGKSTAWLAQAARHGGKRLVSIDPHLQGTRDAFVQTVEQFLIEPVADIHQALSHDVGADWREPIAFLWVDGGHDYEIVRQDIDDFTPHLQPGAFAAFDDVNEATFPGVVRALAETLHRDPTFTYRGRLGTIAIFQKK